MSDDPDLAEVVQFVTVSAAVLVAGGLVGFLVLSERPGVSLAFHLPALAALAVTMGISRAGWPRLAGKLLVAEFGVVFALACSVFGGVRSGSMAGFMLVVLAAGLLVSGRAAAITAVLCSLVALLLVVAEWFDLLPEPIVPVTALFEWVSWSMYLGMAAALLQTALRVRNRALEDARRLQRTQETTLGTLRSVQVFVDDVIRTMGDAVLVVGPDGLIRSSNLAAQRMLGISESDLTGRYHQDLLIEPLPAGTHHGEGAYRTASGERVVVSLSVAGVRNLEGNEASTVWVGHDLTARTQLEQRLREATERAEAHSAAKSSFLANMSHELRTPLNAIIGYAEMLQEQVTAEEPAGDILQIRKAGRTLLAQINDVLDLSKIEAGRMEVDLRSVDAIQVLDGVANALAPLFRTNGNRLSIDVEPGLPRLVTDEFRFQQIMTNLLSNAAKFTQNGSVVVTAVRDGSYVQFAVQDTGIGIDENALHRVFDAFVQADGSTTRRFGGTGLGLTITRKLCELLRGELTVRSTLGRGSVFVVRLPIGDPIVASGRSSVPSEPLSARLSPLRIETTAVPTR